MNATLKAIWVWFDGKKCIISTMYWSVVVPCLPILYPQGVPSTVGKVTTIAGLVLSAFGLGHKAEKVIQAKIMLNKQNAEEAEAEKPVE